MFWTLLGEVGHLSLHHAADSLGFAEDRAVPGPIPPAGVRTIGSNVGDWCTRIPVSRARRMCRQLVNDNASTSMSRAAPPPTSTRAPRSDPATRRTIPAPHLRASGCATGWASLVAVGLGASSAHRRRVLLPNAHGRDTPVPMRGTTSDRASSSPSGGSRHGRSVGDRSSVYSITRMMIPSRSLSLAYGDG